MRRAPWCALLCCVAASAAAQERAVTFEEPQPVSVTGFTVGRADYDRLARRNSVTAGKLGVSLFKPAGDVYLFAQLTTALEGAETSTEIDNLLVSWTPQKANQWTLAFGRFDAPIGFERDDEPLNLIATNSFNFTFARPGKLTGLQVHYTASPRADVWAVAANGWDVAADNNRGKTGMLRAQVIPIPWVTVGVTGVYGPERDSTDAHQRSLVSGDLTIDRGRLILGAEVNIGREQQSGGNPTWRGAAVNRVLELFSVSKRRVRHPPRPWPPGPSHQVAVHVSSRPAGHILCVWGPDGLALCGLHPRARGGYLRGTRHAHADAARDDHGEGAPH